MKAQTKSVADAIISPAAAKTNTTFDHAYGGSKFAMFRRMVGNWTKETNEMPDAKAVKNKRKQDSEAIRRRLRGALLLLSKAHTSNASDTTKKATPPVSRDSANHAYGTSKSGVNVAS
jgi:hypothetical protein